MDFNILITSNGPGEMSTWVQPMINEIRATLPEARILLALVPCPHSSGFEEQFSSRFIGATVMNPNETVHYLLTGQLPSHVVLARHGVILHLGGDQLFSVGLGWRTRFPVTVYTEKLAQWSSLVNQYFVRDQALADKLSLRVPEHKLRVVGDLMLENVQTSLSSQEVRQKLNLRLDAPVVSVLPGSKPIKVLNSVAFMLRIVDEISLLMPQVQFVLPQSPFTPLSQIRQAVQDEEKIRLFDGVPAKIAHDRNSTSLITPQGNKVQIVPPSWHYNLLQISDLSITLPGTNTAELGVLGIPMLVILPLQKMNLLPLDGIASWISKIPVLGPWIKKNLVYSILQRLKYLALPNQKAQAMIVPEMVGDITAENVAHQAYELLTQPLACRSISMRLRQVMQKQPTAHMILLELTRLLAQQNPEFDVIVPRMTQDPLDMSYDPDFPSDYSQPAAE